MRTRINQLLADAKDALNCAELLARRANAKKKAIGASDALDLRDRELGRAARCISRLKAELRAEGTDLDWSN